MRLLILGATGGTGRQLTSQAIEHGHRVTALVRSPQKLGSLRESRDGPSDICPVPAAHLDRSAAPTWLTSCSVSSSTTRTSTRSSA